MKKFKYLMFTLLLCLLNLNYVNASCTSEEISKLKEEVDKIKITYKHLGEVIKDDGSKVYNEFLVTASNIPEEVYIHLSPLTDEDFVEKDNTLQITLTTGNWSYIAYSGKCETTIKKIEVKLPRFNIYSLDPLCEGIDSDDFELCSKYYEYEFSRETFERKVKEYRRVNNIGVEDKPEQKSENIFKKIFPILDEYKLYIIIFLGIILLILVTIIIIKKKKKRAILE